MNQFYVSIIFLGIVLIFISIVMILFDRKKSFDHTLLLDEKKKVLLDIINDAEVMLDELNKISDYVVTNISTKHEELNKTINTADEKIKDLDNKINSADKIHKKMSTKIEEIHKEIEQIPLNKGSSGKEKAAKKETANSYVVKEINMPLEGNEEGISDIKRGREPKSFNVVLNSSDNGFDFIESNMGSKPKAKTMHLNARHREVLTLSKNGMNETDIAKRLNMGKGEIQLILGMNK